MNSESSLPLLLISVVKRVFLILIINSHGGRIVEETLADIRKPVWWMLSRHSHSSEIAALITSITFSNLFFAVEDEVTLFYFGLKLSYCLSAERAITQRRNSEYVLEAG